MIRSHYSNFDTYMIHLQKHPGCLSHVMLSEAQQWKLFWLKICVAVECRWRGAGREVSPRSAGLCCGAQKLESLGNHDSASQADQPAADSGAAFWKESAGTWLYPPSWSPSPHWRYHQRSSSPLSSLQLSLKHKFTYFQYKTFGNGYRNVNVLEKVFVLVPLFIMLSS